MVFFAGQDETIATGLPVEYAAEQIVRGILLGSNEVVIAPWYHRIVIYLKLLFPTLFFKAMEQRARKTKPKAE